MATESAAIDAQTQGPTILAACWVLVVIPGLIVALRLWCKLGLSRRGFGWDDLLICLAWVSFGASDMLSRSDSLI
jgi:hypothetical protein